MKGVLKKIQHEWIVIGMTGNFLPVMKEQWDMLQPTISKMVDVDGSTVEYEITQLNEAKIASLYSKDNSERVLNVSDL